VRVDASAVPGAAKLRVELKSATGKRSRTTELPIVLTK
jgi:hypothetical protein